VLCETGDGVLTDIAGIAGAITAWQHLAGVAQRGTGKAAGIIHADQRQAALVPLACLSEGSAWRKADLALIGAESRAAIGIELAVEPICDTWLGPYRGLMVADGDACRNASDQQPQEITPVSCYCKTTRQLVKGIGVHGVLT
jgi:hypothetical protein